MSGQPASFVYAGCADPGRDAGLGLVRRFLIADAYARFRRQRGDAVLFALGVEATGEAVEAEAARGGVSPGELVDGYLEAVRGRFERLGISCDWERTVVSSRPEQRRRAQLLFRALLERDLVYRRATGATGDGSSWLLRTSAFAEECDRGLEGLSGWRPEAIDAQRAGLGRVEGVEVGAELLGGGKLSLFTPYAESISEAAFVSISPNHPRAGEILSAQELAGLDSGANGRGMVQSSRQAAVPGVGELLPVVLTASVDARFGPTAALGIPARDETDRGIAERLQALGGLPFKAGRSHETPRPVARYRFGDLPVSRASAWGTPVPVAHCPSCGAVPLEVEESPAPSPQPGECACPRCGGEAERDPAAIDWGGIWAWLSICVPPQERGGDALGSSELERWLPAARAISGAEEGSALLCQRVSGRLARELEAAPSLGDGEPFAGVLALGPVRAGGAEDDVADADALDELIAADGADVARLAILHAAAPARAMGLTGGPVRHSRRFLAELREYAEPRLGSWQRPEPLEIDRSARLRRRLAAWCRIAEEKIAASSERLEMHQATYDAMLLLERIEDFERRCAGDGELAAADRDAVYVALLKLVEVSAPFIPHLSAELSGQPAQPGARLTE
ncbi:MAG: class I tRNA ligase family protein [Solirubrobacterales bacterium]